jgi:hypothetical protein
MGKTKAPSRAARSKKAKREATGRAAVTKGAAFEADVAELYRLLGAEVIQNIEIANKKVDLLATFRIPGSSIRHRVIVECKDEKRRAADNQRVMQFHGLLETARKLGVAESAEIITRVPWGDAAKGYAHANDIGLFTYAEKTSQLIDFAPYLRDLIRAFDVIDDRRPNESALGSYYVSSSAERIVKGETVKIPKADEYISESLAETGSERHLALLGEYGTGKTSLSKKLARDLADDYLKAPGSVRIPILFSLREFTKKLDIEAFVTSFLDKECGAANPKFKLFSAMNNAGIFLLIFDALDEMAVRVDADTLEVNLQEIEKLAAPVASRVLITSRIEYFISREEQEKALRPKGNVVETRTTQYGALTLLSWSSDQVDEFIKKRVPLIKGVAQPWTYYRDSIRRIPGLSDLSSRPVLLEMIVKTLPELIASGKPINRPNLYETYLRGEIRRQRILKKRELLLSEELRFSMLQQLALDFYDGAIPAITFSEGLSRVCDQVKPPKVESEAYTREFLTCSFLTRQADEFRFSHSSIMEYLAATALIQEVKSGEPVVFGHRRLQPVVTGFMVELSPKKETLWQWIAATRQGVLAGQRYLGGNAATLLCASDKAAFSGGDLSKTNLTGASLAGADLMSTGLLGTIMDETDLSKAKFLLRDLADAEVSDTQMLLYVVGRNPRGDDLIWKICRMIESVRGADARPRFFQGLLAGDPFLAVVSVGVKNLAILRTARLAARSVPGVEGEFIDCEELDRAVQTLPERLASSLARYRLQGNPDDS